MIGMDYESLDEALYVVSAERQLSQSNPYENPSPLLDEFEPSEFVGPPTKWEWEIDQFVNGEWEPE